MFPGSTPMKAAQINSFGRMPAPQAQKQGPNDWLHDLFNNPSMGFTPKGEMVQPWNTAWALGHQLVPWAQQQGKYARSLEPAREASINQFINAMSPGGRQAQVDNFRRNAMARAKDMALGQNVLQSGQGRNTATEGNLLEAQNQANNASNSYSAQLNSPEGLMQALQGTMGAIGQGQQITSLDDLMKYIQAYYGGKFPQDQIGMQHEQMQGQQNAALFGGLGSILGGLL